MKLVVFAGSSLLLLIVAAFCLFGFLATFEPTGNESEFMIFRIAYAVIGIACLAGLCFVILRGFTKDSTDPSP